MLRALTSKIFIKISTVTLLTMLSSCQRETGESALDGVAVSSSQLWQKNTIDVCWESEDDNLSGFKEEVRFHIVENFNKTALRLVGWTACSDYDDVGESADIRIFIFDNPEFPKGKNFQDSLLLAITSVTRASERSVNLSKL